MSEWHQKALDAARQGRWEEAIGHAKRSPPSYNTWQQLPSIATDDDGQSKMPAHAIHQVLDHLTKPFSPHKANLPEFLFEMASKLPDNLDSNTINRLADHGRDDYVVMNALGRHPNYKPDDRTSNLLNASDFWNQYERDVQPHHFATVKSMFTGAPEALTDHRGQTGSSREHMGLVPHLHEYAAEAQKKLLQDVHSGDDDLTKIRYFKGQPHVKVYRGVSGFYAEAIREAAGLDPATGEVDRKLLKIPVTHLASWSADPALAQRFATVEHPGHPAGQGIVLEKWMPVKDLLHSGYHNVVPNQNKVHPSESELVFAAPKGHIKVPTSGLHLYGNRDQNDMQPVKVRAHSSSGMPSVSDESDSIGKSEQEWGPQSLEKMAIKDIPVGKPTQSPAQGWEVHDYSHVLPEHHRKAGYQILVGHRKSADNPRHVEMRSVITHPQGPAGSNLIWPKEVGGVVGEIAPEPTVAGAKALCPDASHITSAHRGKGLGVAAYEALFAHAKNVHKAHFITSRGMAHSSMAARVHESLARKHGLNYRSEHLENDTEPGEFDFKRGPYFYQNKSDLDWHKSENWDSLEKMAVKDIPKGREMEPGVFDYSHVLTPEQRNNGYSIKVQDSANGTSTAWVNHSQDATVGLVDGDIANSAKKYPAKTLKVGYSKLSEQHRGHGLGTAAYEALFAHAKNHHGVNVVEGGHHSSMAHAVHKKLADKHRMNYQSKRRPDFPNYSGPFDDMYGPYEYDLKSENDWHKSENWDSLKKMAVKDIPVGKEIHNPPPPYDQLCSSHFDYSHVLTPEQQNQGYKVIVHGRSSEPGANQPDMPLIAGLYIAKKGWLHNVGSVSSNTVATPGKTFQTGLKVGYSQLDAQHRNKGLGTAAYEALFAHAKNHHNIGFVTSDGSNHSSMANSVHKKLAAKHGMGYKAEFVDSKQPQGAFDEKFGPYEYELKNEIQWAKSESNLLHGANNAHTVQAMLGFSPARQSAFAAARFLAAGNVASLEQIRRALWEQDGDVERAALQAYGLPTDEKTVASLRAVMAVENLRKDEDEPELPKANTVQPGVPTATETAVQVRRAFDTLNVEYVKLPGKHSAGSMIAKDPESKTTFILKPGSGGQSPAAGASEDPSSQSRREAAYSAVARQWGVADVPQADLLLIDGKEYAALHMLGYNYQSAEKAREQNANMVRDAFEKVAATPTLFKWATLDFVLGNPDRHAQNIMVDKHGHIRLIDHGSAFAGPSFSPAHDKNSFVPYYLRFRYGGNFNTLPMKGKMEAMPRLNQEQERAFKLWLEQIDKHRLTQTLQSYGINPKPALARLAQLQLNEGEPADVTVNRAWAGA